MLLHFLFSKLIQIVHGRRLEVVYNMENTEKLAHWILHFLYQVFKLLRDIFVNLETCNSTRTSLQKNPDTLFEYPGSC